MQEINDLYIALQSIANYRRENGLYMWHEGKFQEVPSGYLFPKSFNKFWMGLTYHSDFIGIQKVLIEAQKRFNHQIPEDFDKKLLKIINTQEFDKESGLIERKIDELKLFTSLPSIRRGFEEISYSYDDDGDYDNDIEDKILRCDDLDVMLEMVRLASEKLQVVRDVKKMLTPHTLSDPQEHLRSLRERGYYGHDCFETCFSESVRQIKKTGNLDFLVVKLRNATAILRSLKEKGKYRYFKKYEDALFELNKYLKRSEDFSSAKVKLIMREIKAAKKLTVRGYLEKIFSREKQRDRIVEKAINTIEKMQKDEGFERVKHTKNDHYTYIPFKNSAYILFKKHDDLKVLGVGNYSSSITLAYDTKAHRMAVMKTIGPKIGDECFGAYKEKYLDAELKGFKALKNLDGCIQAYNHVTYDSKIAYFLEFLQGGELLPLMEKVLDKPNALSKVNKWVLTKDLIRALSQLHTAKIALRDIKPENILLKKYDSSPKLADPGFYVRAEQPFPNLEIKGTRAYRPPEYQNKEKMINYDARKHDVWSMGMILYMLWKEQTPPWIYDLEREYPKMKEPRDKKSIDYLIFKMLEHDPDKRINGQEALQFILARPY